MMSLSLRVLFGLLFFCLIGVSWGETPQRAPQNEKDFKADRERLNQRYEDFYLHKQKSKRWQFERLKSVEEIKEKRLEREKQREAARQEYIRLRKSPVAEAQLEKSYEQQQKKQSQERAKKRKAFVNHRQQMQSLREGAKYISPKEEVGL